MAIAPGQARLPGEFQIGLVNQARRGESTGAGSDRELAARSLTQLVVQDRHETVESRARMGVRTLVVGMGHGLAMSGNVLKSGDRS